MKEDNQLTTRILDNSAVHLLHRAGQCAGDIFTEEVAADGLTPRQFAVLSAVSDNEGLSQTDLVELTGIDRSTLADIIRRMLKKDLLQRRRTKADARAYSVKLTSAGRTALQTAKPAATNADMRLLSALPPAKRNEFIDNLNTIVGSIATANNGSVRKNPIG